MKVNTFLDNWASRFDDGALKTVNKFRRSLKTIGSDELKDEEVSAFRRFCRLIPDKQDELLRKCIARDWDRRMANRARLVEAERKRHQQTINDSLKQVIAALLDGEFTKIQIDKLEAAISHRCKITRLFSD